MFKYINCIDVNSQYCPCELAEQGECLVCSQLNGGDFCECKNYSGLCIYQEFIWNGSKACNPRSYHEYPIIDRKWLREDILLMKICVEKALAQELYNFGAFVFLKKPASIDSHGMPISIVEVNLEDNVITVAIKIVGFKTKIICSESETIMVKGPYWNGIQGQMFLKNMTEDNCLILGRGIGLAPAIMAACKLKEKGKQVFAYLEKGRSEKSYFEEYFKALKCEVTSLRIMDRINEIDVNGLNEIMKCIDENEVNTVLSAGSDLFHQKLIAALLENKRTLKFATVNNATMCCGEGNCGSCIISVGNRSKVKACKLQYNPLEYFCDGRVR